MDLWEIKFLWIYSLHCKWFCNGMLPNLAIMTEISTFLNLKCMMDFILFKTRLSFANLSKRTEKYKIWNIWKYVRCVQGVPSCHFWKQFLFWKLFFIHIIHVKALYFFCTFLFNCCVQFKIHFIYNWSYIQILYHFFCITIWFNNVF